MERLTSISIKVKPKEFLLLFANMGIGELLMVCNRLLKKSKIQSLFKCLANG